MKVFVAINNGIGDNEILGISLQKEAAEAVLPVPRVSSYTHGFIEEFDLLPPIEIEKSETDWFKRICQKARLSKK